MENGTVSRYINEHPECDVLIMVSQSYRHTNYLCTLIYNYCQILGIAEGVEYLHLQGVIHSDIKAVSLSVRRPCNTTVTGEQDNVLVSSSGIPRICDFGISRMLAASQTIGATSTQTGGVRGSVRWMAPELILPSESPVIHSTQTDIWAFGMTVYVSFFRVYFAEA